MEENQIGDTGVEALAGAAWLYRLQVLNLTGNSIGVPGLRALLGSPNLRLRAFGLGANRVLDEGAALLAASPRLADLRLLDLFNAGIGETGVVALATSPGLVQLRALKLHGSRPGPRGIEALAGSRSLDGLRTLDLSYCDLGDVEAGILAEAPSLAHLHRLEVTGNAFSERGSEVLQDRFGRRLVWQD